MAAKAEESPQYQHEDRLPVIQLDHTFVCTKGVQGDSTKQQAILTLIDVRSQLVTAIIAHQKTKGTNSHAVTEAKRFLYELGRTNAILQTDDETPIKGNG